MSQKLTKIRFLLLYGLALGGLLILMAWANYRFVVVDYAQELYSLLVATVFVSVGIWAGLRWSAPAIIEKMAVVPMPTTAIQPAPNPQVLHQFGISPRELDVLILLSKGLSNNEIASQLFVSTNTVKTHLTNLYVKLDVKRRTQAIEKARSLGLLS